MTNWNYADVWETVADVQPDAIAVTQGDRHVSWAEFDRGADGVARYLLDLGVVQQDKMALYLYNCPEYLEARFAAFKVGLVPDQHQLPLRRRRAQLPVGERRRGGGGLPRVLRRAHRGDQGPGPGRPRLALGRRRHRARARTGPSPTKRRPSRLRPAPRRPVGPQRRRPLHALHRRDHRHAQGRHVAPGRPVRPPDHRRASAGTRSTVGSTPCASPCRPTPHRPHAAAGLSAHARHRWLHRQRDAWPRADGSSCSSTASTTRSSCSTRSSARR